MATKLSNVIGAPFRDYVLQQLNVRAIHNSSTVRSNEEVLFLANKTAWARLTSSVDIILSDKEIKAFYDELGLGDIATTLNNQNSLAKNWVLEAGTSIQNGNGITLRQGIGPNGAYGLGGVDELGYRPMPGLTSVQVETTGRLGSLRQATITFKVWNMNQLNVVEALYFRLGYSMLLEWGHTQYYSNNNSFQSSEVYGIGDPFVTGLRKEAIQQAITKKSRATSGNYDGMLGVVSNFTWAFNQEGGYDCTVRLIGLGSIMDSMRINQVYKLPEGILKEFKKAQSALEIATQAEERARKLAEELERIKNAPKEVKPVILNPPKNLDELYQDAQQLDLYKASKDAFVLDYGYYPAQSTDTDKYTSIPDIYYQSSNLNPTDRSTYNDKYFGLFLRGNSNTIWKRITTNTQFTPDKNLINATAVSVINQREDRPDFFKIPGNTLTGQEYSYLGRFFYLQSATELRTIAGNTLAQRNEIANIALTDTYNTSEFGLKFTHQVGPTVNNQEAKDFYLYVSISNPDAVNYPVTRQQVVEAFDNWFSSPNTNLQLADIETQGSGLTKSLYLTATAFIPVKNVTSTSKVLQQQGPRDINLFVKFRFNDTAYIKDVGQSTVQSLALQQAQSADQGNTEGTVNQASTATVESTQGFESALHAMLVLVQTTAQVQALNAKNVVVVDVTAQTQTFYQDGSLNGIFGLSTTPSADPNGIPFDVLKYALKGYNSNLMMDPKIYDQVPNVSFKDLCKAYVVKYPQGGEDGSSSQVRSPVYIQLGYLLAFLNNMCLIYDSTQPAPDKGQAATEKRPYVYIDFNPNTNFCLTSPQQLSVDPLTCLIPVNATLDDYKAIFPSNISITDNKLFNPGTQNVVSKIINSGLEFKTGDNSYQGKTMNILLNIDYLLSIIKSYSGSDPEHAVNLQPFLERVMSDINRSLGNVNLFRVAYRDDSNTIEIQDDQWVPSLAGRDGSEPNILLKNNYYSGLRTNPVLSGQLPVFGSPGTIAAGVAPKSLARQFQLKTTLSTKLASMIAISAQAATASVNAKDHSSLSYLNRNYRDRYKPYIQDPSNGDSGTNTNSKSKIDTSSNDQKAAELFNEHIKNVYFDLQITADKIESSRNYYIERMSKVKSKDPVTLAAPFIPADLELTIDGVSGIIMGNAFTIPEDRLPISLRGDNGLAKVGFIVTGLTHTIESNQWLTRIKGQMIKLRDDSGLGKIATPAGATASPSIPNIGGCGRNYSGACPDYSCAEQVLPPASINTQNFKTYYPNYTFKKGTSDIKVSNPLTEAEIIDDTAQNRFKLGTLGDSLQYFVIHHTGGRGTAADVYKTFYCRGFPAQYVIDRDGKIHRFLPDGALGWQAKDFNSVSMGVEVIASNDADVLDVQKVAAARLAKYLGFKRSQIIGHGQLPNQDKAPTEGLTITNYIKSLVA